MINRYYSFCRKNLIIWTLVIWDRGIKEIVYKTLGTNINDSPISHPYIIFPKKTYQAKANLIQKPKWICFKFYVKL